tara:strand:+ start:103 stop:405 length:303 start_codon:yes stop_codon:yes gene_type:complete
LSQYNQTIEVAKYAAHSSTKIIVYALDQPKNVNLKGNLNLVTLTDKESELNIKSIISGVLLDQTILGEEELKRKEVTIKDMDTGDQKTIEIDSILTFFHN